MDNIADCVAKGRINTKPARDALALKAAIAGRTNRAKLTREQVSEIRALILAGIKQVDIAKMFGVHFCCISDIKRGYTWK